jgi:DNA-binding phage protein
MAMDEIAVAAEAFATTCVGLLTVELLAGLLTVTAAAQGMTSSAATAKFRRYDLSKYQASV